MLIEEPIDTVGANRNGNFDLYQFTFWDLSILIRVWTWVWTRTGAGTSYFGLLSTPVQS